jgi:TetR/AcrR family transcriptional repressor of nem operon
MPYAPTHKAKTKSRIIDGARRLFNRRGFENVSITQIMAGAGLTHGWFYSYFKSKSDLYAGVMDCFFTNPEWEHCWEGVEVDLSKGEVGPQIVRAYLSRQHFDDVENSCPMVALPTDVSRSGEGAKAAFETVFRAMVSVLERSVVPNGSNRRTTAQAIAAMCIGGMIVARTVLNRSVADELRQACTTKALEIGGWNRKRKRRRNRAKGVPNWAWVDGLPVCGKLWRRRRSQVPGHSAARPISNRQKRGKGIGPHAAGCWLRSPRIARAVPGIWINITILY